ncbi:hypothetical protein Tco_0354482, partial [Tanacetum coccineum]
MRPNGGSAMVFENCGFNGNTIDRCFKIIGYLANFEKKNNSYNNNLGVQNFNKRFVNNNSVGSSFTSSFSDEHNSKLISLIKENSGNAVGKGVHANMEGIVLNNNKLFSQNFKKFLCSNIQLHYALVANGLIVDSGAKQLLTYI